MTEILTTAAYAQRVLDAFGVTKPEEIGHTLYPFDSPETAQRQIKVMQVQKKALESIRREIGLTIRDIRSHYATEKTNIGKGAGSALLGGLFGRKSVGRANAVTRDQVRQQEHELVRSYENMITAVDSYIGMIDRLKLVLEEYILDVQ